MCALYQGVPVDTTIGFSALNGLVMGTLCGAIDPGILIYFMRRGMDVADLEELLYCRCRLLGVSGISSDMGDPLTRSDPSARQAIEIFVFRVVREIYVLAATMAGLDVIVFTAGIGENAGVICALVCSRLQWLGVQVDPTANNVNGLRINALSSKVDVFVIPTGEELVTARHTTALLS